MNRRTFFSGAASALAATRVLGANDRVRIGIIGPGSRATYVAGLMAKEPGTEIAAAADVYEPKLAMAAEKFGAALKPFRDHRALLELKDIDAVLVGTPDHWHVPASIDALSAGRDVYCEKPVTHKLEEGEALIAAVQRSNRVFASGLQQRAWPHYRQAKSLWQSEKLGRLYFAQMYWYMGPRPASASASRPAIDFGKLDWNRFVGNAPEQGFEAHKYMAWRAYWDFGGGMFADLMTHWVDVVQWFAGAAAPETVQAEGIDEPSRRGEVPATVTAMLRYPGNFTATYDGSYIAANHESGIVLRGTEGTMILTRDGYSLSANGSPLRSHRQYASAETVNSTQDGTIDNVRNWLECIRTRAVPQADVKTAVEAARASHLANLAVREQRIVHWPLQATRSRAAGLPPGFKAIFNGRDLSGWHISQTNHHGTTPIWKVENGVLMGTQNPPGKGGILLTDRRYRNFEVLIELKPDFGCDGGLFLRSNEKGQAYQVMLDYLERGNVGGIYGEGLQGVKGQSARDYAKYWKKDDWNTLRARIEGDVPHIQVWLNGQQITDWTDTANHAADGATDGMIAVQVHLGDRWVPGGWHRFRTIAVKEL